MGFPVLKTLGGLEGKKYGFVAESCLQATIWHLLVVTLGSASPGYVGYPRLTLWPSDRCHLPYRTPSLFLVLLKEKF